MADRVWEPSTEFTLCRVPWDSNYQNIVQFPTSAARDSYFSSIAGPSFTLSTYLPVDRPIVLDLAYGDAYRYNYLVVKQPKMADVPASGEDRPFYYFITSCDYSSPHACTISLMLDVWTTYAADVVIGKQYVERGHVPWCNTPAITPHSSRGWAKTIADYWLPCDPLDTGTRWVESHAEWYSLQSANIGQYAVMATTVDLTSDYGTVTNATLTSARGTNTDGLYSAVKFYAVGLGFISSVLTYLSPYPWISQNILAIYCVPDKMITVGSSVNLNNGAGPEVHEVSGAYDTDNEGLVQPFATIDFDSIVRSQAAYNDIPVFMSSKWLNVTLDNNSGSQVILAPELWPGSTMQLRILTEFAYPWTTALIYPQFYGAADRGIVSYSYQNATLGGVSNVGRCYYGDFLEAALWLTDFPQFAVVNNGALLTLASSAAARQAAARGANMTYATAQTANGMAAGLQYEQIGQTLNFENQQAQQRYYQDYIANQMQEGAGQLGFELNRAASNLVFGLGGILRADNDAYWEDGTFDLSEMADAFQQGVAKSQAGWGNREYVSDYNLQLAQREFAYQQSMDTAMTNSRIAQMQANTNYQSTMLAIEAQEQAAQMVAPGLSGCAAGPGLLFKYGYTSGIRVRTKRPQWKYCQNARLYMQRYGFPVQEYVSVPADLCLMSLGTFWQMPANTIQLLSGTERVRDTVRGIFAQGVTVWSDPRAIPGADFSTNAPLQNKIFTYYEII